MQKRLNLFGATYLAFYYLIHIIYDMPGLVNGSPRFHILPSSFHDALFRVCDIVFNFLFALIPYWVMVTRPTGKALARAILFLLVLLPIVFLAPYVWERGGLTGISKQVRLRSYFEGNLTYSLSSLVFGIVFYSIRLAWYRELQRKELELQSRRSELSFLRSQINPHFLFNSLNNIYSLVYQGSGQALNAIAGLSDLLRYMLYDTSEQVGLLKEMDYIQKYIDLQRVRFDHPIRASIRVEGDCTPVNIAPLLLIPFVENAFKHGDFSAGGAGMTILLQNGPEKLLFHCTNGKGNGQKDPGGGIGLENVKRRLELLYAGRHRLTIDNGPVNFTVNLELNHA